MNRPTTTAIEPVSAEAPARVEAATPQGHPRGDGATRPLPDDALIIVPVRNVVLFPGVVFPLTVGRERSRAAAQEAARLQRPLGVLLQSKPEVDEPGRRRPALGRHHGQCAAVCHGPRRPAPRDLQGYQALPRPAVSRRPSVPGRTRGAHRRARPGRAGDRRPCHEPQAARGRDPAAAAAGSGRDGVRAAGCGGCCAARRLHCRADGHRRRGEAGAARDLRPQDTARQAARAARASRSRCCSLSREIDESDQGIDRPAQPQAPPARADAHDPEGARRR